MPSTGLLADDETFLTEDELAKRLELSGDVGAYCGSGVTASVVVVALASLGVDAALYPGSWSEWSSDGARPVETG